MVMNEWIKCIQSSYNDKNEPIIVDKPSRPQYEQLLISWNLEKYANKFKSEGWDEPVDWAEMTDDILENDIGLNKGHIKRFQRLKKQWINKNNKANNNENQNDFNLATSPLEGTYNKLLRMGFSKDSSLKGAYKFPGNIDEAIKWIMRHEKSTQNILNEEDKIIKDEVIDDCKSVETCGAIKRITSILKFYSSGMSLNKLANCLSSLQDHKDLICDYHHILQIHLNAKQKTKLTNTQEFALIYKFMMEDNQLGCDAEKCEIYLRNERQREKEKINVDNNTLLYMNILDCIHCFFAHSIDTGYIVIDEMKDTQINKETKKKNIHHDKEMKALQSYLKPIRGRIGSSRRKNKFVQEITDDVDKLWDSIPSVNDDDEIESKMSDEKFSFGAKFNFWDAKGNHKAKYSSIKQEVLSNIFCEIPLYAYDEAYKKAEYFIKNSDKLIMLKSSRQKLYGIKSDQPMQIYNVLSVIFYTDYDTLSYHFTKSFRPVAKDDTYAQIQKRNSEYWCWSKSLIETINTWGTTVSESEIEKFYCGVSRLYFEGFIATFNSPTSTTCQLSVAAMFAQNNGIILELEMHDSYWGKYLRFFNCSLVSAFGNENERLFIQPPNPLCCLQFYSIRNMSTDENYREFIAAFLLLEAIFDNKKIAREIVTGDTAVTVLDLIENQNECPEYIVQQFKKWTAKKDEKLRIDLNQIKFVLPTQLSNYLILSNNNVKIPSFDKINMIFTKTMEIECVETGKITYDHLSLLLSILKKINEPLDTIYLLNVDDINAIKDFETLKALYEEQNWEIEEYDEGDLIINKT
eukprot:237112_1